jgi:hypothetical protein
MDGWMDESQVGWMDGWMDSSLLVQLVAFVVEF